MKCLDKLQSVEYAAGINCSDEDLDNDKPVEGVFPGMVNILIDFDRFEVYILD